MPLEGIVMIRLEPVYRTPPQAPPEKVAPPESCMIVDWPEVPLSEAVYVAPGV